MQTLTYRTTMLFSPDLYRQLKKIAQVEQTTIANLVRRAVVAQYLVSDKKERLEALKRLSEVGGATGDWEEIEKQILQEIPILTNNTYLGFFYWALNFFIFSVSKGST